jgi:hypothetical protein
MKPVTTVAKLATRFIMLTSRAHGYFIHHFNNGIETL